MTLLATIIGIAAVGAVEMLRWDTPVGIERLGAKFRVPNAYTAEISCELARLHPELRAALTSRKVREQVVGKVEGEA